MASTRSKRGSESVGAGDKRPADQTDESSKKPKTEPDGKLDVKNGELNLKNDGNGKPERQDAQQLKDTGGKDSKAEPKSTSDINTNKEPPVPSGVLDEPKHGTLESGHVYFLYRPKIDAGEIDSVDDVSKFHILLIPTSGPYAKSHYHRVIAVGRKHLPNPDAKREVIWGMVESVGTEKSDLKKAFGAYSYETKTRGTRHQSAARPAARGHYILHSPRDELADSPEHNRQRDYKLLLAYEITTPASEDFGQVQKDLGIAEKTAVAIQVKAPEAEANDNPRAATLPRERRAEYPKKLHDLFGGRRWIPANPPTFLDYTGGELLILNSPHSLSDSLGKEGEKVESDMDKEAEEEAKGVKGAMDELGMNKKDTEIEALEGAWA